MSLLSKIGDFAKRLIKNPLVQTAASIALPGVGGIAAKALGAIGTAGSIAAALPTARYSSPLPALPSPGTGFVTGGGFPSKTMPTFPTQGGMALAPRGFHPAKDGSGRMVRNRRMNPYNPQAARRAVRRIKALRRAMQRIERSLPTRTVHSRKR